VASAYFSIYSILLSVLDSAAERKQMIYKKLQSTMQVLHWMFAFFCSYLLLCRMLTSDAEYLSPGPYLVFHVFGNAQSS
jgi:hypothetical protein